MHMTLTRNVVKFIQSHNGKKQKQNRDGFLTQQGASDHGDRKEKSSDGAYEEVAQGFAFIGRKIKGLEPCDKPLSIL
jgi:hypothetical protein